MNTTIEQIRAALELYLSENTDIYDSPQDLLSLLENADDSAKDAAESIEGVLALYAVNRISRDSLQQRLRGFLDAANSASAQPNLPLVKQLASAPPQESQANLRTLTGGVPGSHFVLGMSLAAPYMTLPTVWGTSLGGNMQAGYVFSPDAMFVLVESKTFFEAEPPRLLFEQSKSISYEITVREALTYLPNTGD